EDARKAALEFSAENPDYRVQHADLQDMANVTTRQIYQKGAWILHMLRNRLGDDTWWHGIRDYYRKHRNSTASTDDFQRAMESACDCALGDYFDYWLRTGSVVTLDGGWQYTDGTTRIQLARGGHIDGTPQMTLEAAVYFADSPVPDIVSMPLAADGARFEFETREKPVRVLLDPNTRLLAKWTFDEITP
ncbi:MAG: M1 family aminopeptidase, partial [Pseudomonadota bacterium]